MIKTTTLLLLVFYLACSQTAEEDRVKHDVTPDFNGTWYSGYLTVSKSTRFHYVLVLSEHDTDNDPVLVWFNGGPGCSSMLGFFHQNGPLIFVKNSTILKVNPYSWHKKANVLYIESPGSVGFSIGPVQNSDDSVRHDNLQALRSFYSKFPKFRSNELYLSGESYAGIYVPYLALTIHQYNLSPTTLLPLNLKGIIVGNACTDPLQCYTPGVNGTSLFQYQFLYKRGFYTDIEYDHMRAACVLAYNSNACKVIRDRMDRFFANTSSDIYNVYSKCYRSDLNPQLKRVNIEEGLRYTVGQHGRNKITHQDEDCGDSMGATYLLNQPLIREGLHVGQIPWFECNDDVFYKYKSNANASYWIYPLLMQAGYRVWVYSGDVDGAVPITGTINWIQKLREEFKVPIMQPWREWWTQGKHVHEDQQAGMVWKMENLTFVSVKNAGHMVPEDQPEAAFALINTFLVGGNLPEASDASIY